MSHQISRTVSIDPAVMSVSSREVNSFQSANSGGKPVVGMVSNTFVRVDARPVSCPCQYGLEADNASKIGR